MVKKALTLLLLFIPIAFIYRNWFTAPFVTAPDFPYFFRETLADYRLFPPVWASSLGIGLGGEMINQGLGTFIYFVVSLFVNGLGLPWETVYKIFIFGLFSVLSIYSCCVLLREVIGKPTRMQHLLSVLLFAANTYILMVVDGGQVGVALAYSVAPLVLTRFMRFSLSGAFVAGLVLAVQVMFDLRVAILTLTTGLLYGLYHYAFTKRFPLTTYAAGLVITAITVFGLHAHWILPIVASRSYPGEEMLRTFSSVEGFQFFSFAMFSQTLSLLHPNWPENIFGKVYFMRPEFLVLPIMAFAGLFFVKKKSSVPFFVFLGLMGAFFAKGANPPFGGVNEWLFVHIPLSSLFRDPTKFYLLTAISLSILAPFALQQILDLRPVRKFSFVVWVIGVGYVLFLVRPAILGQLGGTFARYELPKEYVILKDFLHEQPAFNRALWVPKRQRYNYYSYAHPAVAADRLFFATSSAEIVSTLRDNAVVDMLSNLSVQYLIVPYDSFGEIFVSDRKYDEKQYAEVVAALDATPWFERIPGFGRIAVYKTPAAKDHFWLDGEGSLKFVQTGSAAFTLQVTAKGPSRVVFTDTYSPYWVADTGREILQSEKTAYNLNSFSIAGEGTYSLKVYFSKQRNGMYGRIVTAGFLLLFFIAAIYRIIETFYELNARRKD